MTCGERTITTFALLYVSMLGVFHMWRTEVDIIYGGLGSKFIVRQTQRSAI